MSSHHAVLNEAVCSGSPDLIALILHHREVQQQASQARQIPNMLQRLQSGADFYIEMTWDFSSWGELGPQYVWQQ